MDTTTNTEGRAAPWNKGKLPGQKPPLKPREIWAIRVRLQLARRARELALFNLAIDSKLRGCDLVGLRVHDVVHGSRVAAQAIVMQRKTQRPVQFEINEQTRDAVANWIAAAYLRPEQQLGMYPGSAVRLAAGLVDRPDPCREVDLVLQASTGTPVSRSVVAAARNLQRLAQSRHAVLSSVLLDEGVLHFASRAK
jgi:hypothetical protein